MGVAQKWRGDANAQQRRAMLAKIHLGKKELCLDEDDYRAILLTHGGALSSGEMDEAALRRVLDHYKRLGWKPVVVAGGRKGNGPKRRAAADHPVARKARALWISLYHLGAVQCADEKALEAFVRRQLKCQRLQWADQSQGNRLIEALKAMAEREGWTQDVGTSTGPHAARKLSIGLLDALLNKLVEAGAASPHWSLSQAAWKLSGADLPSAVALWPDHALTDLARSWGDRLREARYGQA